MNKWYIDSIIGMIFFTSCLMVSKRVSMQGVTPLVLVAFMFSTASILFLAHIWITNTPLNLDSKKITLLLIAGFFSYVGNLYYFKGFSKAPNPGYAISVNSFNAVLVTIFAAILFGSSFTIQKIIGIILCVVGVGLVVV